MVTTNNSQYHKNDHNLEHQSGTEFLYLKKQKLNEHLYQLHLHSVHQWLSTWSYIQDIAINQLLVMTEKLRNIKKKIKPYTACTYKKKTSTKICG